MCMCGVTQAGLVTRDPTITSGDAIHTAAPKHHITLNSIIIEFSEIILINK